MLAYLQQIEFASSACNSNRLPLRRLLLPLDDETIMAGFLMKQMVGGKLNDLKGGMDKLAGGDEGEGTTTETGEDPEVIAARQEQEERRKEKHRKMEAEREKMRNQIRGKYNIQKKEEDPFNLAASSMDGRIGGPKKTPEEMARMMNGEEDDSLIGQLGLTEHVEKAKTAVNGALETVRGFLPFGK
ncbi:hypothetical protein QR680_007331 [Steinernema hermaphroditum]|uniref:Putative complexin-1 n=1 Tax=Steinernema hermaphroditum TaxID=289476 RepID=A0AA39M691_9BILA|nr:hypothetical protein QR680_007331 [Steinernema hermaphroditum]